MQLSSPDPADAPSSPFLLPTQRHKTEQLILFFVQRFFVLLLQKFQVEQKREKFCQYFNDQII